MPKEKRYFQRRSFEYPCWIGVSPVQPCRLLDISGGGAKVAVRNPTQVPDEVPLYLTENRKVGRDCRVAWRSDAEVGLEFLRVFGPYKFTARDAVEV